MAILKKIGIALLVLILVLAVALWWVLRGDPADLSVAAVTGDDPQLAEPDPQTIPTVKVFKPVGWPEGAVPEAAEGLAVTRFAEGLDHPRIIYPLPNGDILVSESNAPDRVVAGGWLTNLVAGFLFSKAGADEPSPDKLVLLRDADGDGKAEAREVLRDDLQSPGGLAWQDGKLYVADHNALLRFDYQLGDAAITGEPEKLLDLPGGGNHWMRNIVLSPDGNQLYITVGSASNIGEGGMKAEENRAAIHEYDIASGQSRPYALGLRNPNGLAWNPWSGELWTTVNERDMLGSDLVPDYLTNVPVGAQYGWPWIYWGDKFDDRVEAPMPQFLAEYTRRPEFALGPHVAALGLAFTHEGSTMGAGFDHGAFIARHGSWNRKPAVGLRRGLRGVRRARQPGRQAGSGAQELPPERRRDQRPPDLGGVGQDRRAAGQRRYRGDHLAGHQTGRRAGRERKCATPASRCRRARSSRAIPLAPSTKRPRVAR